MTDKELALRIMMLLSALKSWGFAASTHPPDYLIEELEFLQDALRKVVLFDAPAAGYQPLETPYYLKVQPPKNP